MAHVKPDGHHILLLRDEDGNVRALDNRCPHEGYSLAQGDLKGQALTCSWHNWKFDIRTGRCLLGGEGVRSFPTRIEGEMIEVDLARLDPEVLKEGILSSFHEGLSKHENDRAIRDGIRWIEAGFSPWELLSEIGYHDALHVEYGTSHALAAAADWGRYLDRLPGAEAMYAIAPAIDMCGEECQRLPRRERPRAKPGGTLETIRAAAEAEDAREAEALLLGAIDAGVAPQTIESWLSDLFADHFNGFGHTLIYLMKAHELFEKTNWRHARDIFGALLYRYVVSTREDTLPYMKPYADRLAALEPELAALHEGLVGNEKFDGDRLAFSVLDGNAKEALDALEEALRAGADIPSMARGLVAAAAQRFLRFDPKVEADQDVAETWIWVTHRFTYASAVRTVVERLNSPSAIRYLFHALAFIHTGRRMDQPRPERDRFLPAPGTVEDMLAAIRGGDRIGAVNQALGLLEAGEAATLRRALESFLLEAPAIRPIVWTHLLKTVTAAWDEYDHVHGHPDGNAAVLAAVRMLASHPRERSLNGQVRTALRWVVEGIIPKKLTQ